MREINKQAERERETETEKEREKTHGERDCV